MMRHRRRIAAMSMLAIGALVLAACGGGGTTAPSGPQLSGPVVIDGSSTVEPLSAAAAEEFQKTQSGVQVTVSASGTGGGFQKFCAGETDISNASRPIKDDAKEAQACAAKGISYAAVQVANDALTIVVNKQNTWATCLTTEQLKTIWAPGSTVKTWNQVDPSFPAEPLTLFGPGPDSGTFDYFTEAINGKEGDSRTDYSPSEDDNIIVQGVEGSKGAMGYFGYSYYEENMDKLNAVQVNSGGGCVAPSAATVQDDTYKPLGRPLFIYPSGTSVKSKPQVAGFVQFSLDQSNQIAEAVKFIPMNDAQKQKAQEAYNGLKSQVGAA